MVLGFGSIGRGIRVNISISLLVMAFSGLLSGPDLENGEVDLKLPNFHEVTNS